MMRQVIIQRGGEQPDLCGFLFVPDETTDHEIMDIAGFAAEHFAHTRHEHDGQYGHIRYRWAPIQGPMQNLELQTVTLLPNGCMFSSNGPVVPRGTVDYSNMTFGEAAAAHKALKDPFRGLSPVQQGLAAARNVHEVSAGVSVPCNTVPYDTTGCVGGDYSDLREDFDGVQFKENEACSAFDRKYGTSAGFPHQTLYPNRPDAKKAKAAATDHRVNRNAPKIPTGDPHGDFPWCWAIVALVGLVLVLATCHSSLRGAI